MNVRVGLAIPAESKIKFQEQATKKGLTMNMYLTLLVEQADMYEKVLNRLAKLEKTVKNLSK